MFEEDPMMENITAGTLMAAVCLSFGPAMLGAQSSSPVARATVDGSIYRHIVQVGWVVKDLDPVVDYWQKLGLKDIQRDGVRDFPNVNYRGKIINLKMKMAFGDIGGVQIEWIQPVGPKSVYDEFLAKHGDGMHHLAYQMPSSAVMDQQIQYFKQRGVKVVQSGTWKGQKGEGRFAYLDTAPEGGGITLELIYHPDWPLGGEQPHANEYPFTKIGHYAFVVSDVHKVGDYWQRLGFGGLQIDRNVSLDRVYRGQPGKFEMYLGWNRAGDTPWEWVQSLAGPNIYEEYLRAHGEGFHHLGLEVADMDAAIAHFKALGVSVSQSGGWDSNGHKGRFAYLDTDAHGAVTIELIWNQPRAK
jgi:methylmalonyl-CoA/ethylmalonyl-CoA epimerase